MDEALQRQHAREQEQMEEELRQAELAAAAERKRIEEESRPIPPTNPSVIKQYLAKYESAKEVLRRNNGIIFKRERQHNDFNTYASRLETLNEHFRSKTKIRVAVEEIAAAGFFYCGPDDMVVCFQCGGGLKDFGPKDRIWAEHVRWFPECQFMQIVSTGFIDKVHRILIDHALIDTRKTANLLLQADEEFRAERDKMCLMVSNDNYETNDETLRKQIDDLLTDITCAVCLRAKRSIVILPCLHWVTCAGCASSLDTCCICRERITGYFTYISS